MATILIVDDSALIRTMLKGILVGAGHSVIEAADGDEAIRIYSEQGADLVFLDIFMPGKEGGQTMKELLDASPQLPIVAMSAGDSLADSDILSRAKNNGARVTLEKPLEFDKILKAVETLVI